MLRSVRYVTSSVSMLGAGSSISSASAVMLFAWRSSHHVGDTEHERRRQIIASIAAEHVSCIASNSVADTLASCRAPGRRPRLLRAAPPGPPPQWCRSPDMIVTPNSITTILARVYVEINLIALPCAIAAD